MCWEEGLYWQGLVHDWDKFLPWRLWWWHHNDKKYCDLLHKKMGKHHWQWYVLVQGEGDQHILEMPERYRKEMMIDWQAAYLAQGKKKTVAKWYEEYKSQINLHPTTRKLVERDIRRIRL